MLPTLLQGLDRPMATENAFRRVIVVNYLFAVVDELISELDRRVTHE